MSNDTIFALSTAPGKSGVAVVRISGDRAFQALEALSQRSAPAPNLASLRKLYMPDGALLDQALCIAFAAPKSFTGEDVVELHLHGSRAIIRMCINALSSLSGLRLAEAGEFSRRAFEHGKLDLLEVEAIADIIDAETEAQARQSLKQLSGHMSGAYQSMRANILESLALIEAYIDFPDEDIPDYVIDNVQEKTNTLIANISNSLSHAVIGERNRSGYNIAIIGAPNVGKSSLLNALSKREAAIVSATAGTTRDVIELRMEIAGFPVNLSDTAGIRDTENDIEKLGIERSFIAMDQADIILCVSDAATPDLTIWEQCSSQPSPKIAIINKADLVDKETKEAICKQFNRRDPIVFVSTFDRSGFDQLEQQIEQLLMWMQPNEEPIITQARHRVLLEQSYQALINSQKSLPIELWCEELRLASQAIGEITGIILPDELLGSIFSKFCIGK